MRSIHALQRGPVLSDCQNIRRSGSQSSNYLQVPESSIQIDYNTIQHGNQYPSNLAYEGCTFMPNAKFDISNRLEIPNVQQKDCGGIG